MAISYKIDQARQHVFTNVSGSVSVPDILGHFESARREGFLPCTEMIDASSIISPTLSVGDIGKAALAVRKLNCREKFGPRAVLVANEANFVLAQMFTTLLFGYFPIKVFRDPVAAGIWLNEQRS